MPVFTGLFLQIYDTDNNLTKFDRFVRTAIVFDNDK